MTDTQQPSALVTWCSRLALTFLLLVPVSVLGVKFGLLDVFPGLGIFALSCVASLVLLLLLAIISFLPKYAADRRRALTGSLYALPPVLLLGALLGSAGDYPPIHDITSDPDDPPIFVQAPAERGADANSIDIKPEVIAIQREHYPDLAGIESDLDPARAFERALEVAAALEWQVYNSDPAAGIIEASYTSFWFGFVDDIVIRVRPTATGAEIDLRSVSRVGQGDLGANANRIRAFARQF
jgi:uncharacterized protein (DUF1499 family)